MRPANDVLAAIRSLQVSPPVDVSAIAKVLGLNVWQSQALPDDVAGKLFRDPRNGGSEGFSIVVRAQDSKARKRFTVAHEIGHFLLHKHLLVNQQIVDNALYRSNLSTPMEAKANGIAADILMPWHLLLPLAHMSRSDLAGLFEVSTQAIDIRLDSGAARRLLSRHLSPA